MRRLALLLALTACHGGAGEPGEGDAATPVDTGPVDTGPRDATVDGCATACFAWDPWPSGPVAYRRVQTRCNFSGATPGRCPPGFECGPSVDVPFDALTREERVCVPAGELPALRVPTIEPPPTPAAPSPVELLLAWPDGSPARGTLRVLDASGAAAFAGSAAGTIALALAPGLYTISFSAPATPDAPAWVRGGELRVGAGGRVALPLARAALDLEAAPADGTLVLLHAESGVVTRVPLADAPARLAVLPGAHEAHLETPAGHHALGSVEAPGTLHLEAPRLALEGAATVDGAPAAGATVLFHDLDGDARVEVPVREGRYAAQLHPGRWAVYLDARDAPGLPPVRALVEPALTLEEDGRFDAAASRVRLRGVLTVDGAEAPSGGDDARLGYLQLVDELGVASRGVDVAPGGAFEADLLATRADVRFLGTHPALPRLPTIVASGARPSDVPVRWDLPTRWLEVRLTVNGRPLPEGRLDVAGGRGVVLIEPADGGARQQLPLPPRGAAIAGARVPPGVWRVRYRNALHPTMPRAERSVGEVDLRAESEVELVADLEVVELAIDAPVAALLRFTDLGEEAHAMVPLSSGRATTRLFGGVYRVRRASDGRLLSGWLRLAP